jgi:SAM-dependent methyltransferase
MLVSTPTQTTQNTQPKNQALTDAIRERYGAIARGPEDDDRAETGCCSGGCCAVDDAGGKSAAQIMGYTDEELASLPEGANLGLGCGHPIEAASLKAGETVLDLGSGAGIDCFLAAQAVGESGRVIGVDMTPDMITKSRANAAEEAVRRNVVNVEFRLGEIENLPVGNGTVDAVISNCVVNLSTNKPRVWEEVYRALRPGGRIAISDIVATAELPAEVREDQHLVAACAGGAESIATIESQLRAAGFEDVAVEPKDSSRKLIETWSPEHKLEDMLVSAIIRGRKPG